MIIPIYGKIDENRTCSKPPTSYVYRMTNHGIWVAFLMKISNKPNTGVVCQAALGPSNENLHRAVAPSERSERGWSWIGGGILK